MVKEDFPFEEVNAFLRVHTAVFTPKTVQRHLLQQGFHVNVREIPEYLDSHPLAFELNGNDYISRAGLFTGEFFSIKPSRFEIQEGILVVGHRCMPFTDPEMFPHELNFYTDKKAVTKKCIPVAADDILDMYRLFGEEYVPQFLALDPGNEKYNFAENDYEIPNKINLTVCNMKALYERWNFAYKDRLLAKVVDWDKGTVELSFLKQEREAAAQVEQGIMKILNAAPLFNQPMLVLFYPYREKGLAQGLAVFFSVEKLSDGFGQGTLQTTYLVNDTGDVLIHPDFDLIRRGASVASFPLFTQMRENGDTNRQVLFKDDTGKKYFGSYTRLSFADAAVLTTAEAAQVLEPVNDTAKRNLYLSIAVLALSAMFVWFLSKSISTPIKLLTVAAHQIEAGEYELDLKPKTHDEIGLLTSSFVQMGKGLAERERLKDSFGRFINKEIAGRLNISITTVITHRKNIMEKLGMKSVSALTIYAVMHGYVDINKI